MTLQVTEALVAYEKAERDLLNALVDSSRIHHLAEGASPVAERHLQPWATAIGGAWRLLFHILDIEVRWKGPPGEDQAIVYRISGHDRPSRAGTQPWRGIDI